MNPVRHPHLVRQVLRPRHVETSHTRPGTHGRVHREEISILEMSCSFQSSGLLVIAVVRGGLPDDTHPWKGLRGAQHSIHIRLVMELIRKNPSIEKKYVGLGAHAYKVVFDGVRQRIPPHAHTRGVHDGFVNLTALTQLVVPPEIDVCSCQTAVPINIVAVRVNLPRYVAFIVSKAVASFKRRQQPICTCEHLNPSEPVMFVHAWNQLAGRLTAMS